MCCSVGFARTLGFGLLPLALCCILAHLLLLFPMGEISYLREDRLASYVWYFGGLGGGGALVSRTHAFMFSSHGLNLLVSPLVTFL